MTYHSPIAPYEPVTVPVEPDRLPQFLRLELTRISETFRSLGKAGYAGSLLPITKTTSLVAGTGAATALPALPAGYLAVMIAGVERKIPFYNL